jgi:hypothetical protein
VRLLAVGCYGCIEMIRFSMIKLISYAGYLPVHDFAPFTVVSRSYEKSLPDYGGAYSVKGHSERYFYPT